jgi:hypothetical protein
VKPGREVHGMAILCGSVTLPEAIEMIVRVAVLVAIP